MDDKINEADGDNGESTFRKLRAVNDNLYKERQGIEKQRIMDIGLCNTLDLAKITLKKVRVLKDNLL